MAESQSGNNGNIKAGQTTREQFDRFDRLERVDKQDLSNKPIQADDKPATEEELLATKDKTDTAKEENLGGNHQPNSTELVLSHL